MIVSFIPFCLLSVLTVVAFSFSLLQLKHQYQDSLKTLPGLLTLSVAAACLFRCGWICLNHLGHLFNTAIDLRNTRYPAGLKASLISATKFWDSFYAVYNIDKALRAVLFAILGAGLRFYDRSFNEFIRFFGSACAPGRQISDFFRYYLRQNPLPCWPALAASTAAISRPEYLSGKRLSSITFIIFEIFSEDSFISLHCLLHILHLIIAVFGVFHRRVFVRSFALFGAYRVLFCLFGKLCYRRW